MNQSDFDYLESHRSVWAKKPVLRRLYLEQFYALLLENLAPGTTSVEIGSGPGLLDEIDPSIIRTDILYSKHIHCVTDAHHLPFANGSVDNLLGLDVLHHFSQPVVFLREAARVLRPEGRLVLVEPWITPFSQLVYTYLHQETCDLSVQPWVENVDQFAPNKKAFDGNAAIPYLLATKGKGAVNEAVPALELTTVHRFSSLTYLLSLGFKPASFLPNAAYPLLYSVEKATRPLWEQAAALRALLVWTKTG